MDTVIINNEEIKLNSSLNESAFGRTNYFTLINEKGCIYTDSSSPSFSSWSFDGVKADDENDKIVYYYGKNVLSPSSKTLESFFNSNDSNLHEAVLLTLKALTSSLKTDTILPLVGGEGIIIDIEQKKVLFLPESIFKYSTNILNDEEYFYKNSGYLNNTIKDKAAISFERALITYKYLTSSFPYNEKDEEKRNADILDKNFVPIEECLKGIDEKFANDVNKALMLNSTTVEVPGKKKTGVDASMLTVNPEFDFDAFNKVVEYKNKENIKDCDIKKKIEEVLSNKKAKIEASRKLRRNRTAFLIALGVIVVVLIMTISEVHRRNSFFTTKGSTSTEVIQNFFYGVNNKDLEVLNTISNGKNPDKYVGKITEIFLTEKQITGFTKDSPFFSPEQWLFTITDENRFNIARVFGVTNLTIDNIPEEMNNTLYRRNEKPLPVKDENGNEIMQGDITTHNVEYYSLQTELGSQNLVVNKIKEKHTLTFRNGKWLISDLESTSSPINVDTKEFTNDYFTTLKENNGDVIKACSLLREKYPFLPSQSSLITEMNKQL